jgi:hypothetical protein
MIASHTSQRKAMGTSSQRWLPLLLKVPCQPMVITS